ncbi:MAG: AraC family transcriptional regulator [Lachnospiraceae bacterium]|nr:AraC family transcriptional regulator [Lachnospiraceae bacterium]
MTEKLEDAVHWLNYSTYEDLKFYEAGTQKCHPDYGYGPIIRDKYILHYVVSGKGRLEMDGKSFPVHEKQAFIIPPGVLGYYQADTQEPWHYIWLQFHGPKATEALQRAGLTRKHPIFTPAEDFTSLEDCLCDIMASPAEEYTCMGKLYQFFQLLVKYSSSPLQPQKKTEPALHYVQTVINYISEKYSEPIRIQEIADYCGLDRTYLGKVFKRATGYTPQKYLLQFRIKKAKDLLKNPDISIQHICYSIGYSDPLAFSKLFKQETGMAPTEYRKQVLLKES